MSLLAGLSKQSDTVSTHNDDPAAHGDIRAAITGLTGAATSASTFGFLPTASGADNAVALQAAADASPTVGTIWIPAGTYDIAAGVAVPSNCSLVFSAGVTLRKTAAFSRVFYPVGVPSRAITSNVTLEGCNTTIAQNGQGSGGITGYAEASPMIDVYFTDNWRISGFIFDVTTGTNTFTVHGGECTRLLVENCKAVGSAANALGRCTFQLQSGARNFVVRNMESASLDDDYALNASDYPDNVLSVGDIENGLFENIVSNYLGAGQVGYLCRLTQGAWAAWGSGSAYKKGDCVNHSGRQYKVSGSTGPAFPITAANAPVHTSGTVSGADGITWKYMGTGTGTSCSVRNITFRNIQTARECGPSTTADDDAYNRAFYPGTERQGIIDGILVDGVKWAPAITSNRRGFTSFGGCNVGSFEVRRLTTATAGSSSLVYLTGANVESYLLANSNIDHNSTKLFDLLGAGEFVCIKNLGIERSTILGHLDNAGANDSFIRCLGDGGLKKVVFRDSAFTNHPNLLSASASVTGLSLTIDNCRFAGNAKIVANYGESTPISVYRRNCAIDVDDGSLFYSLYSESSSPLSIVSTEVPVIFQAVGSGTAYQFKSYVEAVTFGTTSPTVSVTKVGKYRVRARLLVKFNAATFAAAQTLRVRLRVGVGYNAQTIITIPVMTTLTDTRIVEMPEYLYANSGGETVALHADMSAEPSAGTVTCEECELTLIPYQQA